MQEGYLATAPEVSEIQISISGVRHISFSPPLINFNHGADIQGAILESTIEFSDQAPYGKWERWRLVIQISDYDSQIDEIVVFAIEASDITWSASTIE